MNPVGILHRATDVLLRVPLHLKIVVASAVCSGLAFGLGLTGAEFIHRTAFQGDSLGAALAVGLAWVVIAALVTAGIIRFALAPLRNLEDVAARIERGDLEARASPSRLADRDIARLVRALNQALDRQAAYRERLRELARRSLRSEEARSRRIAVELREGPGQRLAALLVRLQVAEPGRRRSWLADVVDEARGEIATALDIVGRHSGDQVERLLDDLGLGGALEWQARQIARAHGLDVSVAAESIDSALSRQARISLLLLVREALENVGRHARARTASVNVRCAGHRVVAEIVDDGRGFEPREEVPGGVGLLRMEERIAGVGGRLHVTSAPSCGTRLQAEIPVRVWTRAGESRHAASGISRQRSRGR
ncbi:MAG TPA: ATP-binding protein [Gemmatimonadota bacterium]|nr:ATP-binding protein [Gemmatimonadota bacterium]